MNTAKIPSRDELLNDCERSMFYHQARVRFYGLAHLLIQFAVFACATAAASLLLEDFFSEAVAVLLLGAVSVLSLFSLVWNPADKANLHRYLHSGFTRLAGAVNANAKPNDAQLAKWMRELHELFTEEPPVYRALNAHCYNQLAIKLDAVREGYFVDLKWHQRLLRNLLQFQSTDFPVRNQARQ